MQEAAPIVPNNRLKDCQITTVTLCQIVIAMYFMALIGFKGNIASFLNSTPVKLEMESTSVAGYIASSITTAPIVDIAPSPCPAGYTELTLMTWPGIRSSWTECRRGGCKSTKPTPSIQLNRWDSSPFCVKRASAVYYGVKVCPSEYQMCPDHYTCIKTEEKCPINFLQYSPKTDPSATTQVPMSQRIQSIEFQNGLLQFGSVWEGGKPPSPLYTLQVTVSGSPCLDPYLHPPRVRSSVYPLLWDQGDCGRYGVDTAYSHVISYQKEVDFYKANNLFNHIQEDSAGYAQSLKDERVSLAGRGTIKITNLDCLGLNFRALIPYADAKSGFKEVLRAATYWDITTMGILFAFMGLISSPAIRWWKCYPYNLMGPGFGLLGVVGSIIETLIRGSACLQSYPHYEKASELVLNFTGKSCFDFQASNLALADFINPKNLSDYRSAFEYALFLRIFTVHSAAVLGICSGMIMYLGNLLKEED
jgi:hypothetical protein